MTSAFALARSLGIKTLVFQAGEIRSAFCYGFLASVVSLFVRV